MNPLISIIIPTYNRANLISETLDSILSQTYTNWECIVVDDGSRDDTATLIADYIKKDNRFQYYQRPANRIKGANACRNYGFELSNGKYIKWFDSDDIMHPDFLEKQVEVLEQNKELDFCACFCKVFENDKLNIKGGLNPQWIDFENSLWNYIIGNLFFLTPSTLWRKFFLEGKELFDESLHNAHESDFNFRRLIENGFFYYSQEILFLVRRGHVSIDSEACKNSKSIQSQFDYFQKVYLFLNIKKSVLNDFEIDQLKKYLIYRQGLILYEIRTLLSYSKCLIIFKTIILNLSKIRITFFDRIRLLFGLVIILLFKRGYNLIHIKKFDIRANI